MNKVFKCCLVFWVFYLPFSLQAFCQLRLPSLISDGMVLQRETDLKIWGWAKPKEKVNIHFMDTTFSANSNEVGEWTVPISNLKAGGPFDMEIMASDTIVIHNILIGDVWLCSGQSQMDINMNRVSPLYEEEIKNAGNPNIRYFAVPTVYDFNSPQMDIPGGHWESISQKNILNISAVAYFFATELFGKYQIPIGLIRSSLGGSPAEAWMNEDALKPFSVHFLEAQRFKDSSLIRKIETEDQKRTARWYTMLNNTDEGYLNQKMPWHNPDLDVSNWSQMDVPGYWADGELGDINGVIWFRKDLNLPNDLAGKKAKLNLGRIVDADSVFVNGTFVGAVSYQYPPRRYEIPENILVSGKNTIVVRLINNGGRGGFVLDKAYELVLKDKKIELTGKWKYRLGAKMEPLQQQTFVRWKPTGLFNGMIAPLTNYGIKGAIWYQGESNTDRPIEYSALLPAMITNWRDKWGQGDFPFLLVQLHNYMESHDVPTESNWALTREAQLKALSLPNTAMSVAIDLGEWNDIHPLNKKDVSRRLALAARKIAYQETDLVSSGPLYKSMEIMGNRILISFSEIGSGLLAKNSSKLQYFAIASEDGKFAWAEAKIVGDQVMVKSKKIKNPVAVRYAWADNPEGANLYNKEGLPASPFRTDKW